MLPLFYSILAVVIISLISILAIYWLISSIPNFSRFVTPLVSLAVGSLLGDAFIHLLPEASENISNQNSVSLLTILGILIFFSIEKFIRWHHCHDPDCEEGTSVIIPVSLAGEAIHNFIDGVIIAGSFIISTKLGIATSLAVLLHEIPQEVGDFGIYTHQGLSLKKSLNLNLLSATTSLLGVIVTFLVGSSLSNYIAFVLPITAGGFIYLAASDLIPELHEHKEKSVHSLLQIVYLLIGVALMYSLLFLE
ncbi:MAG: ZIP family metal transporter [Candidatus Shapirobacteria bacterium]|jgi:zinc and cadmium transporter